MTTNPIYQKTYKGIWNIRFHKCNNLPGYIAWGSKSELTEDDAIFEPQSKEIYFEFGETEKEVLNKLFSELDTIEE